MGEGFRLRNPYRNQKDASENERSTEVSSSLSDVQREERWVAGRMQGAARSQWLFHWQGSQRRRRRSDARPGRPDGVLI